MKGGQTGKRKAEEVCRRSKGHEVLLMWQKRQKWQNRKKKKDVKNEGGRKEMTEPIEVKKTCSWTPFPLFFSRLCQHMHRLTCTLLQLDAVTHVDVVDADVASRRVLKETFKHHLNRRRTTRRWRTEPPGSEAAGGASAASPDTLWGSGARWFGPPSSEAPGLLWAPRGGSRPGRCPSAGPSGCPGPPPGAGSGTAGRAGRAPAPPRGSAAGPSSAGCGRRRPGSDNSPRNLERRQRRRGNAFSESEFRPNLLFLQTRNSENLTFRKIGLNFT